MAAAITTTDANELARKHCHPRLMALLRDTVAGLDPYGQHRIESSFSCSDEQGLHPAATAATFRMLSTTDWQKEIPGYNVTC